MLQVDQVLRNARLVVVDVETGRQDRPGPSASIRACSSTTLPRATLISTPLDPSAFSTSALIRCFVDAPPGVITIRMSEASARHDGRMIGEGHVVLLRAAVIGDAHVEARETPRDRLADAPEADNADLLLAQGRRERERRLQPFPLAQVAVGLRDLAQRRKQQADGEIGDLIIRTPGVLVTTMPRLPASTASTLS